MRLRSLFALVALAPSLVAAAHPVRLQPSSPWDVDYAEDSCRLIRTFGQGKTLTKLVFENAGGGTDMLAVGHPLETSEEKATARLIQAGSEMDDGTVVRTADGKTPAIIWSSVPSLPDAIAKPLVQRAKYLRDKGVRPPPQSEAEHAGYKLQSKDFFSKIVEVAIETRRGHIVILETGSLGDAVAAFDQCAEDSLKDWGVDVEQQKRVVRPVWTLNEGKWLFAADYPKDMLRQGKEAEVTIRLLIGARGEITKCTPISHYKEEEFKQITCDNISKRARFAPAELVDGTKVPSYYVRRIVFRIAP
jgi:hypothetical protein